MIRIRQVKVDILSNENDLLKKISKILNCKIEDIKEYKIIKKSLDARDKNNFMFIYTVDVKIENENKILSKLKSKDIFLTPKEEYEFKITGTTPVKHRPIIVGAGPSGLFLSYMLSKYGYKPLIIEQGEKIEERVKTVEEFWNNKKLNIKSNIQFGEGGAGTFSDGKLNTLVKDKRFLQKKVFEIFVECGAPKEILYENKPHIGTDLLRNVIINLRNKIISMGGEFRFNSKLTDISIYNNKIVNITINDEEIIDCESLFLCIGHSARDTFFLLHEKNINMKNKPFAVGVRIEHNKEDINNAMFYKNYPKILGEASYNLTYHYNDRAIYSFCMCPGGYVVNASSEENRLVVNGMSNYKRETDVSNSAIVVTVDEKDYGSNLFDGIKFQRDLEEKAYNALNGDIPIQRYIDFKNNITTKDFGKIKPLVKGNYGFYNLNKILPHYITSSIVEGIEAFSKKIENFNHDDSILLGVETRTSSPVTIIRDENGMSNIYGIYPVGEGAGYAGGITTSAMDGIRQAEKYASIYKASMI